MNNIPQFPFYIISKGRSQYMITSKVLTKLKIFHRIIVEPHEVDLYNKAIKNNNLMAEVLELDLDYKKKYKLCDNLGLAKSTGSGPARNFGWDDSIKRGYSWHWMMDDNIRDFKRLNKNEKVNVNSSSIFKAMEDFCLRYKNVAMAGPNYDEFAPQKGTFQPFILNTRIYSCNLIRNDINFRWRGRYNEDTILSLDILSADWCTILFQAFLQDKYKTQALSGGNTDDFYLVDGKKDSKSKYATNSTSIKTDFLISVYPNLTRKVWRFSRIHHIVDYSIFKKNKLIRNNNIKITNKINNYGMELKRKN